MLSLVPRSVAKGKGRTVGATTKIAPVKPLPALEPETAAPAPNQQELNDSGEDWEAIVALVTCTITSCTVSDDFKIKLRTPQGYVAVDTLLDQLVSRHRLTPASVAMALSKAVEQYNVRLAKVKQAKPARNAANWDDSAYELGGMQTEGGGYEFQFLQGQQRARRTEEELAESAIILENVPPRFAYGAEGILQLLSGIDSKLVNPQTIQGIGSVLGDLATAKSDPLVSRHAVIVFDSSENATRVISAIRPNGTRPGNKEASSALAYLHTRGCRARTIPELQTLRQEYLEYQARAEQSAAQAVQTAASNHANSTTVAPTTSEPDETMEQPPAAYPLGCLIYLQNLPENTNKTELKSLLDVYLEGDKVDYVDWKKGQISAYVRVVRPAHASMIIEGLDNNVTEGSLKVQLLKGEQEEIYWMKLPDKIRMAALAAQS